MQLRLHKNARTTPAIRAELRASKLPTKTLARLYGLHPATVKKWRGRDTTEDRSHRPINLRANLTPAQEAVVVELRRTLLLPLDDLLVVTHEFVSDKVSRSGLSRCLRRHGVSSLKELMPDEASADKAPKKTFKDYVPGFVHVDIKYLPQMPGEPSRQYLFVAIDRATRWVYVERLPDKSARHAQAFLQRLLKATRFRIRKVLTDNGREFTDRFCAGGERRPTGRHLFDQVCRRHGIEHRLIRPRRPQTNGMVERFNGRISEVLQTTRFRSGEHLSRTLRRYVKLYNEHIPQRALGHIAPVQALKQWHETHPELFRKQSYNLAEPDT